MVEAMFLKIKKIIILLAAFCFWAGCAQVQQVVTDAKEDFQGLFKKEKADTQKAPAVKKEPAEKKEPEAAKEPETVDKGTTTGSKEEPAPPTKAKKKETKTSTPATKKGTTKTAPTPPGEVFGPK